MNFQRISGTDETKSSPHACAVLASEVRKRFFEAKNLLLSFQDAGHFGK